ncbi:MAG TPA: hypothetical protein VGI52_07100 [Solirubrobacteraceae bacterium]|jgi:hypothetical protein
MELLQTHRSTFEQAIDAGLGASAVVTELPLRCVSSSSVDGCSCDSRISRDVVSQAWQRELEASGDDEARFFHFIGDGGVWMAYGLADGGVRGVYCPSHNSQRAERSRAALYSAGDVVLELPLAA